jgi:hypothetical protein
MFEQLKVGEIRDEQLMSLRKELQALKCGNELLNAHNHELQVKWEEAKCAIEEYKQMVERLKAEYEQLRECLPSNKVFIYFQLFLILKSLCLFFFVEKGDVI